MYTLPQTNDPRANSTAHRGVSVLRTIAEAKSKVPVEALAKKHTELHRSGSGWRGRCPVHKGGNPTSFSIDPEQGRWRCYSCEEHGDVVQLYQRLHGLQNAKEAAGCLLLEFGFQPPQRPDAWFRKQRRQQPVRDKLEEARTEHLQRRLFRRFAEPLIEGIQSPEHRAEDAQHLWEAMRPVARRMREQLMSKEDDGHE